MANGTNFFTRFALCCAGPADDMADAILQAIPPVFHRTWTDVGDELSRLQGLQDDWDGMGAAAPSQEVVRNCYWLMRTCRGRERQMSPPDLVRPTPDGGVAMEWRRFPVRLEIEVSEDSVEFITTDQSGGQSYNRLPLSIN